MSKKLDLASTEPVSLDDTDAPPAETKKAILTDKAGSSAELAAGTTKEPVVAEQPASTTKPEEKKSQQLPEASANPEAESENAPPPPKRPLSPLAQLKSDLKEAFPQIEDKYIQTVIIASQGHAEPAFSALLYLLDPSISPEELIAQQQSSRQPEVSDDAVVARKLQKEYEREERRRQATMGVPHRSARRPGRHEELSDSGDEFDQIKETFTQGFEEAKTTINGWVSGLSKKFNNENAGGAKPQKQGSPKLFGALGGSSYSNTNRRFDEDPEILSSDFNRKVDLQGKKDAEVPSLPARKKQDEKWQPLASDVPVTSDAFLVTDSEDDETTKKA